MPWSTRYSVRRGRSQLPLLAAVAGVIVAATTAIGISTLLLTTTADEGFVESVAQSQSTLEVSVPASEDAHQRDLDTRSAIGDLFAPVPVDQLRWATTSRWYLPREADEAAAIGTAPDSSTASDSSTVPDTSTSRTAYLGAYQDIEAHATLISGRWASAPSDGVVEAAMPADASEQFGILVGDTVDLHTPSGEVAVTVDIVGTYSAVDSKGDYWSHDPLAGQGYDADAKLPDAARPRQLPTSGVLLVSEEALADASLTFDTITVSGAPQVEDSSPDDIESAASAVTDARVTLRDQVDPAATAFSDFPDSVSEAARNTAVTRDIVLIALSIVVALCATAMVLAARLLSSRRIGDRELLSSRGASTTQRVRASASETLALTLAAMAIAPPLACLGYRWLAQSPLTASAALTPPSGIPGTLWLTCALSSLVIAGLLVVIDALSTTEQVRAPRRGALARSGLDVVLVLAAGLGVTQFRIHGSPAAGGDLDLVLALTPVLCLAAGAALTVRLVPLIGAVVERRMPRTTAVITPLAVWNFSRRSRRTSGAVFLLTLAVGAATFAPGFIATWRTSQLDQADLSVGTDVRVDGMSLAIGRQGTMVESTSGYAASPVSRGRAPLGSAGSTIATQQSAEIIGLDASQPGLLRGRPPGATWADVLAPLSHPLEVGPEMPGEPISLSMTMTGSTSPMDGEVDGEPDVEYVATATIMLRDALGATWPIDMAPVSLDRKQTMVSAPVIPFESFTPSDVAYPLTIDSVVTHITLAPGQLYPNSFPDIALALDMTLSAGDAVDASSPLLPAASPLTLTVPRDSISMLTEASSSGDLTTVAHTSATIVGGFLPDSGAALVLTPYAPPDQIPVVITSQLAQEIAAEAGSSFSITVVGGGAVDVVVASVVEYLPTLPTGSGIMIDLGDDGRAAVADGAMDSAVTGWQMQVPLPDQALVTDALAGAHLGTISSRESARTALLDSPARLGVQLAAALVAAAAIALGVAGFALHLATGLDRRRGENARLYGLGVGRRAIRRTVVVEALAVGTLAGALGLLVGGLTNALVSPHLSVSPSGAVPMPAAVTVWPWIAVAAIMLVFGALFACAVTILSRRAVNQIRGDVLALGHDS